ncbi:hypothetical protein KAR50_07970 [Periweissella fabaria]|uniref:Uncharacterized protein n=1 Tax=Periweissella fabaria TaxID=546157 RepID=A0ABM8Z739_9LACO|nr:hypothetical protein [Periweissella fabaria]MCM0597772.1 hypothetical protein [Periweissella fabaria]CAH0417221.1 hypothetical protein WFA24289_01552 [Periweissella fabaria]
MSKESVFSALQSFSSRDSRVRAFGQTATNEFDLSITLFVTQMSLFNNITWLEFLPPFELIETRLTNDATTPSLIRLKFDGNIEVALVVAPVFTKASFLLSPENKIIADKD